MRSKKNRIIASLLICGLILGVTTPSLLKANELKDEESFETVDEITQEKQIEETESEEVEEETNMLVSPIALSEPAFPESSKPLHDAILAAYPSIDGLDGSTADGIISKTEAALQTGTINLSNQTIGGTMYGIENFSKITALNLDGTGMIGQLPTEIGSMEKLVNLSLRSNNLDGVVPNSIGNLTRLTALFIDDNNFSGALPATIGNLINLERLYIQNNEISSIPTEINSLTKMRYIYYFNTNIPTVDLSSLTNVTRLGITKATNANLSKVTSFYVSGSKPKGSMYVRLTLEEGAITWNSATAYYEISSNTASTYDFLGYYFTDSDGNQVELGASAQAANPLTQGALMDNEGNLILGASLSNIQNGKVVLENGGTVVTGSAIYTFTGPTEIADKEITTQGTITVSKVGIEVDSTTGDASVVLDTAINEFEPSGDGETKISLTGSGGTTSLPGGSIVTDSDGNKTYLTGDAVLDDEGNVTSSDEYITVPADKVNDIIENEDGTILFPYPTEIISPDGTIIIPEGGVIYNPETGEVITIDTNTLEITGIPTAPITVGDTFTLSVNIPNGEWEYDSAYFDVEVVESISRSSTTTGKTLKFTAKQNGSTNISYTINGVEKEYSVRILEKQIEPKPEKPTDPSKPILPEVPTTKPSTKPSVSGGATASGNTVNTSDTTNLVSLYTMFGISLLGFTVLMKRKRESNK